MTAYDERLATARETTRRHDAAIEIWGHTLLVDRGLVREYRDPLTAPQVVEVLRRLHEAGADDDHVAQTIRVLVGSDVHRTADVFRHADLTLSGPAAETALESVVAHRDRDAAANAARHRRAADLPAIAAENRHDRDEHVRTLARTAMSLTNQVAPVAGNSLALAATLTTGSTYMLLADAVELLMEQGC